MGGGLQKRRYGREGVGLSGALSVPWCDPGKGHPRLRKWPGDLQIPEQQDQKDRTQNRRRRGVFTSDPATRPPQRLPPRPQLWIFTSQQQTADSAGAVAAQAGTQSDFGRTQKTACATL